MFKDIYNINEIKNIITPILQKYRIKKAAIFGSYAKGKANKKSDIDLLIEFSEGMGIVRYTDFKEELEYVLNRKIDIISYNWINKYMRDQVLKEAIEIYAERQSIDTVNFG